MFCGIWYLNAMGGERREKSGRGSVLMIVVGDIGMCFVAFGI